MKKELKTQHLPQFIQKTIADKQLSRGYYIVYLNIEIDLYKNKNTYIVTLHDDNETCYKFDNLEDAIIKFNNTDGKWED